MPVTNYVYYRGGLFGDLIFAIVNNGVHVPEWIQVHLKSGKPISDQFKNFVLSLPLTTLTGCSAHPLDWCLNNYEVVCSNDKISEWGVIRFTKLYPEQQLIKILEKYYPDQLATSIQQLPFEKQRDLLIKKYQTTSPLRKIEANNLLDVSCIFDKKQFISMLADHFTFDHTLADLQYTFWRQREDLLSKAII
jgi:hypothetical protein